VGVLMLVVVVGVVLWKVRLSSPLYQSCIVGEKLMS
jgi:hypothetical protein